MAMEVKEFASKFHSLSGNTVDERKRSFHLLLKNIPSDHDAIIASIKPKNYLEQLFRLELLLKLERISELSEILKCEDEYLVIKLLKNKQFCQKLASELDKNCTGFIDGVLPFMSYVTRRRLLHKLANYGNNLDLIFDEVSSRYGIHIASDVLLGCTEAKIENALKEHSIKLTQRKSKLLFKKFPEVFLHCLEHINVGIDLHHCVGSYIATKDIKAFMELTQNYNLCANLGKRLTRKLLLNFKEVIIANADKFICSLHARTLIKTLGEADFKQFYFKCFPKNIDSFYGSVGFHNLAKKLGKRYYVLLLEGVKQQYNKSLYDYPHLVNEEMMQAMEIAEREKWAAIKSKSDKDCIRFLKTSESIPIIKEKINVTSSINNRENLINLLLQTCKINQDLDALAEALEYVCSRHRNDDILTQFIFQLQHCFDLKKLEERHWKSIHSLIKIIKLKTNRFYHENEFLTAYTEFLFINKKLTEEDVVKYIKSVKETKYWKFNICDDDLKKIVFLKLVDIMPELMEKDEELAHHDLLTMSFIIDWNKKQVNNDIISVFDHPRLVSSFRKSLEDAINNHENTSKLYSLKPLLELIICKKEKSNLRDEALKAYFLLDFPYLNLNIDLWLAKFQPEVIAANFDKFMDHISSCYVEDLRAVYLIKQYSHFAFPDKAVSYCLGKLEKNEATYGIFTTLAVLSSSEDFLKCVAPFYPSEDKMDEDEDNQESTYKSRAAADVARSFKYTSNAQVLPALLGYCKGDFLRFALESMYYLFYHLPGNKLNTFLGDLSTKAVSARKHAIFLVCIVGEVSDVKTLIARFIEKERNVSVQKHLFTAALKYFIKNPSDEFWEYIKICMTKLDKNDSESFSTLVDLRRIPVKYQASHVVFAWEILNKAEDVERNRTKLLSSLSPEAFKNLPLQFPLKIIAEDFLKRHQAVDDFILSYLANTEFRTETLNAIFDVISEVKKFKDVNYENLAEQKRAFETLGEFVETFVRKIGIEERNEEILRLFAQKWYLVFVDRNTEMIEEHLRITFAQIYCEFGGEDLMKVNKAITDFLNELMMSYGICIVDIFAEVLKTTFDFYKRGHKVYFDLCMEIIARNELVCYLLVVKLLPEREPDDGEELDKFKKIVQLLRGTGSNLILLSLNHYIRNMYFS